MSNGNLAARAHKALYRGDIRKDGGSWGQAPGRNKIRI